MKGYALYTMDEESETEGMFSVEMDSRTINWFHDEHVEHLDVFETESNDIRADILKLVKTGRVYNAF